ncbi:acyl-ACP--UDP-N-acetylglucosamine O-acyltransferase [Paracraurococcus ruber]|uniref:Acyl-[acyl-carrier-protein]--UDP-N-acetylglucosamine O-acyltransferase n=1 Tax=Paracraurococcus ruber TaxID=77675 RepID=A0ABS1CZ21_9PROT|nr:acyl-[acyl-carrier-protein]--UDP-N-acetylglucosamine O-acyltransferase [Paracraurococcus ruber]TDG33071.1 acyl-ACP--UDP-N-acetylglucosamine O-acyltransferase [Paracraurococcus ruber]
MDPTASIAPGAVIAEGAVIGAGCRIGPFCSVGPEAVLEDRVELVSHVVVDGATRIGAGTKVLAFSAIGTPPQDLKYKDEPTRCEVGPGCLIREGVTIHRASVGGGGVTTVGAGCMLMAMAHVAHDCRVGDGVILANNVMLGGHVWVGEHAFVGGGAAVHQTVRIGRLAMVSGLAGVTNDIPPFGYVFGLPARLVGFNKIGLLRRGATRDQLRTLRTANNLLFKDPGEFAAKLEQATQRWPDEPLVQEVIAFVRDSSRRRQLVRPGRMAAPELGGVDEENGDGA